MRVVRQVPVDHVLSAEEHMRASAGKTPTLLHRDDIGVLLDPQEQLQRGREWYGELQNFGLDSLS